MYEVREKKPDEEKSKKETKSKNKFYYIFSISYIIITFLLQLYYYINIFGLRAYGYDAWPHCFGNYQNQLIVNELKSAIPQFKMLTIVIITSLIIGLLFNNFYKSNNDKEKFLRKKVNIYCIISIVIIILILLFSNPINYIDKQIALWSNIN